MRRFRKHSTQSNSSLNLYLASEFIIADGLTLMDQKIGQVDLLVLDVDQKDPSLSMSCPPPSFVEEDALLSWKKCLTPRGILAINIVCRDKDQRAEIIERCRKVFQHLCLVKCDTDINQILLLSESELKNSLPAVGKTLITKTSLNLSQDEVEKVYFMLSRMS